SVFAPLLRSSAMLAHLSKWHFVVAGLVLGVALGVFTLNCNSQPGQEPDKPQGKDKKKPAGDYQEVNFLDLNIVLLTPEEDKKTGFVVAGKNATSLVRGLKRINGRTIAELEMDMRPGQLSSAG